MAAPLAALADHGVHRRDHAVEGGHDLGLLQRELGLVDRDLRRLHAVLGDVELGGVRSGQQLVQVVLGLGERRLRRGQVGCRHLVLQARPGWPWPIAGTRRPKRSSSWRRSSTWRPAPRRRPWPCRSRWWRSAAPGPGSSPPHRRATRSCRRRSAPTASVMRAFSRVAAADTSSLSEVLADVDGRIVGRLGAGQRRLRGRQIGLAGAGGHLVVGRLGRCHAGLGVGDVLLGVGVLGLGQRVLGVLEAHLGAAQAQLEIGRVQLGQHIAGLDAVAHGDVDRLRRCRSGRS